MHGARHAADPTSRVTRRNETSDRSPLLVLGLLASSTACAQALGIDDPIPGLTSDAALGIDGSDQTESGTSVDGSGTPVADSGEGAVDAGAGEGTAPLDASDSMADGVAAADAVPPDGAWTPDAVAQDDGSAADAPGDAIGLSDGLTEADVVAADAPSEAMGSPDPSLVGYWSFDEGTGATAGDSSGYGNHGSLQGGATWGVGKVGSHSLAINAAGGFVDVPRAVVDTTKPYTVSAWVNSNAVLTTNQCVASIDGNAISGFFFLLRNTSTFSLELRQSDGTGTPVHAALSNAAITARTWHYFAGVFDGSRVSLYVDGALNGSSPVPPPWAALGHTAIGRSRYNGGNADYLVGSIDEVRIHSRALTAAEIQALYALR
jgi:hypothetical protein